jgi:hypothetical protein
VCPFSSAEQQSIVRVHAAHKHAIELKNAVMPMNNGVIETKLEEAKQEVNPITIKEPAIKE